MIKKQSFVELTLKKGFKYPKTKVQFEAGDRLLIVSEKIKGLSKKSQMSFVVTEAVDVDGVQLEPNDIVYVNVGEEPIPVMANDILAVEPAPAAVLPSEDIDSFDPQNEDTGAACDSATELATSLFGMNFGFEEVVNELIAKCGITEVEAINIAADAQSAIPVSAPVSEKKKTDKK